MAAELADVGEDVAVGEGDAFGLSRGAGGEEEEGFVVAFGFAEAEDFDDEGGGEEFGEDEPAGDFLFDSGDDAFDEEEVAIGWPGESGDFADEGVGGEEAVEVGLFDGGAGGFVRGREVEIDGDFIGKNGGDVGD